MDNYLVEKAELEQFVDELFKRRTIPASSDKELYSLREKSIEQLSEEINFAIFGHFSPEQLEDIEKTIDAGDDTPEYFQALFAKHNIDLKKVVADTAAAFGKRFLGAADEQI